MHESINRGVSLAGKVIDVAVGGLLLCVVVITLVGTGIRYLFGGAIPWSQELNLLLWAWMIQLGALRTSHIRIRYFVDAMPPEAARVVGLAMSALSILALLVLTWGAVRMAEFVANDFYVSMPWLSEKYAYYPLFVVGPVWIALILADEIRSLRRLEG